MIISLRVVVFIVFSGTDGVYMHLFNWVWSAVETHTKRFLSSRSRLQSAVVHHFSVTDRTVLVN